MITISELINSDNLIYIVFLQVACWFLGIACWFLVARPLITLLLQSNNPDFTGATLIGSDFTKAEFYGISFKGADLTGSNFTDAIMIGCDFRDANLKNVCFKNTDLRDANLEGAKISSIAQITTAKNWQEAKLDPEFYHFFKSQQFRNN